MQGSAEDDHRGHERLEPPPVLCLAGSDKVFEAVLSAFPAAGSILL